MQSPVTILVVEDDKFIQKLMLLLLGDEGYDVKLASNGLEALDLLSACQPDLIFLDVAMPIMDGETFLSIYREHFDTSTPIILLSATVNFRLTGQWTGISAFLAKPFDIETLLACVTKHLRANVS